MFVGEGIKSGLAEDDVLLIFRVGKFYHVAGEGIHLGQRYFDDFAGFKMFVDFESAFGVCDAIGGDYGPCCADGHHDVGVVNRLPVRVGGIEHCESVSGCLRPMAKGLERSAGAPGDECVAVSVIEDEGAGSFEGWKFADINDF